MDLATSIRVEDYQTYLSNLGAEYVREGNGKHLFYLHEIGLWAVASRSGEVVYLNYYEDEGDCGC